MTPDDDMPDPASAVAAVWRRVKDKSAPDGWRPEVLLVHDRDAGWRLPRTVASVAPMSPSPLGVVAAGREELGASLVVGVPLLPGAWAATLRAEKAPLRLRSGLTESRWVGLADARALIAEAGPSKGRDALDARNVLGVLDVLAARAREGRLRTRPVVVLRHAHARPRASWSHADAERPLVTRGLREADALVDVLACWRPEMVVSSPWRRCTQTLAPFVQRFGVKVRAKGGLTESGFRRDPAKAERHLRRLLADDKPALLCTHRPVLAGIMPALAAACADDVVGLVPGGDPWLAPAELLVAHVAAGGAGVKAGTIVAVERHKAGRSAD